MVGNRARLLGILLILGSLTLSVGCGGSSTPPATDDSNATSAKAPASESAKMPAAVAEATPKVERHKDPMVTVREFLTALKSGDQPRATSMLSVKAQQEMARSDAAIQPPGSPTAKFEVTEVEYMGEEKQGAHVMSVWTDVESSGEEAKHEIVWILRQESAGWAIAGFATTVFEDQPPLILNFENPQDLQRKRTAVDAEIARRNQLASPQQADLK